MNIGYQTLDWSAETYDEENNNKSKNKSIYCFVAKSMKSHKEH